MDLEQRQQLGEKVRARRIDLGWSQVRLANEAEVSENTILSIESAKRMPQGEKLRAVLDALGMAPPNDQVSLDLTDVPEDAANFLRVAARRFAAMAGPEFDNERARILADVYPRILPLD